MSSAIAFPRRAMRRVWTSKFARNVAVVASGTAGAQAITMAFAPFITRIYGPEAFGLLGTFTAIVGVAAPAAALAFPIAIVLPKEDSDALDLARLSILLSFIVALLAAGLIALTSDQLAKSIGAQSVAGLLYLIPLAMIFSAWMQIAQQWLTRKTQFGVVARAAVGHSLILNTAKVGIGWVHSGGAVLIMLATLGPALHATLLFLGARRLSRPIKVNSENGAPEKRSTFRQLAYRYRDFPVYRAPQNLINAASQSLPVLMLATLFGPAQAGFYTLGMLVMGAPSSLLGKAVSDVFYPRITNAARNGENLSQHILRSTGVLLGIGIIPFGAVVIFGPDLFKIIFGAQWSNAGEYARWLALFFLFNFINKPCVASVPVLGIQRGLLIYELFSTAGKSLALVAGFYWFSSDIWAVALFSISGVATYAFMMLWIYLNARNWSSDAKASR